MLSVVVCVFNPHPEEGETQDAWDSLASQSSLLGEIQGTEKPCFKSQGEW